MTEPTNPLRLAVVGAGVIGRHHATVAVQHPDLQVVALVDAVPEAAMSAADAIEAMGVARPITTSTIEEAIDQTDIDVVAICSPSGMHVQLAEAALAAGKHVVIEKPLDTTMPRARQIAALAAAARDRGLVTSVISQHRFDPASAAVARAAHDGGFGTVTSGLASVAWYRSQGYYDSGDWRGTWALDGGGAVMNQGVHTVDLLVAVLGRPVEVFGYTALLAHERIETEDVAVGVVRFASGALGVLHGSTAVYPGLMARLQVHGDRGSAVIENDQLTYFHATPAGTERAEAFFGSQGAGTNQAEQFTEQTQAGSSVAGQMSDAHLRQYRNVLAAIRGEEPLRVTLAENRQAISIITGLYESARTGAPVRLDTVPAVAR